MPPRHPEANTIRQSYQFCTAPALIDLSTTPRQREGINLTVPEKKGERVYYQLWLQEGLLVGSTVATVSVPVLVTLRLPVKRTASSSGFAFDVALHR
jgi:hypothetical protein